MSKHPHNLFPNGPRESSSYLPYVALFAISLLLYVKTIGFDFIPSWDDADYVLENPLIRGLDIARLKGAFSTTFVANYAPLHILSYSLDFALWGLNPAGFHLTNVLLHAFNACALYWIVRHYTASGKVAFLSALLFAVHPVNVENAAWVTERKTLLATAFLFLTLWAYVKFRRRGVGTWYAAALLLYTCAILSKASVVTLPLILAATKRFFPEGKDRWLHLIPFFAISLAGAAAVLWAHSETHAIEEGALTLGTIWGTVLPTMIPVFWKYVALLIWPLGLSGYYDTAVYHSFLEPAVLVSLAAWVAVFGLVFWKGTPPVKFWFLWFWFSILPVSNIIPLPVYYADRYLYTPAIGLFVLAVLAAFRLMRGRLKVEGSVDPNETAARHAPRGTRLGGPAVVLAIMAVLYGAVTFSRIDVWKDELAFWEDTVKKSPGQYRPHLNLGVVYEKRGELEAAEREYEAAYRIYQSQEAAFYLSVVRARLESSQTGAPSAP